MSFDDFVILIAWGVAMWVWFSSVDPCLESSVNKAAELIWDREEARGAC